MPFEQYLQQKIFTPLAMKNTRYTLRAQDRARIAAVYEWHEDGSLTRIPDEEALEFNSRDWPLKPGSWGLVSTLDDYMRFARMLQNGGELDGARILKPGTIRLMATDAMPAEVTDKSWLPSKGEVGFGIDFAVRIRPPANVKEAPAPSANSSGMARRIRSFGSTQRIKSRPYCSPNTSRSARSRCTRRSAMPCTAGFRTPSRASRRSVPAERCRLLRPWPAFFRRPHPAADTSFRNRCRRQCFRPS